jgi:hypothetical protein
MSQVLSRDMRRDVDWDWALSIARRCWAPS